tara:strand:- start:108 stop:731 length:624 start_codon:yes stop_codon:yes gene_type:complete
MKDTHQVTLDMMINHATSVQLGVKNALTVVDMPKNSYRNVSEAKKNAKLIIKKTKCNAVKIESNRRNFLIIKKIVKEGIPVMGHIGFTPQFKSKFKPEGLTNFQSLNLLNEAKKIEEAGAFAIVLECISSKTAGSITKNLKIPTIGIGSSVNCDGQVLVTDDILGLSGFKPKFVKKYVDLNKNIEKGIKKYRNDVRKKTFPKKINSF